MDDENFARAEPYPVWERRQKQIARIRKLAAHLREEADRLDLEAEALARNG